MTAHDILPVLAALLAAALLAELAARALRAPVMLVALGGGVVLGPHVTRVVDVGLDALGPQLVLGVGVSFILFHGGLGLSLRTLHRVRLGLGLLVVPGVVLTCAIAGLAACAAFGVPLLPGLLIGAALAPTDPTVLIPLFERLRVRPQLAQTIIAESALNDPAGAVLALTLAGMTAGGHVDPLGVAASLLRDVGLALLVGAAFGLLLAVTVSSRRAGVWRESAPLAVVAVVVLNHLAVDAAGGSAYLGAFIAGLVAGNASDLGFARLDPHDLELRVVAGTIGGLAGTLVFLLVGATLPWGTLADHAVPALAVVAVLVLVARPLTVASCLLPDRRARWTRAELAFMAWTRETGVIPVAVAGVLTARGVAGADLVTATVAAAVIVTVGLQATTKPWLARSLELGHAAAPTTGDSFDRMNPGPTTVRAAVAGASRGVLNGDHTIPTPIATEEP